LAARFFPFAFIRIKKKIVTLFNEAAKMMGLFSFGQEAQVFFTSAMIRSQIAALSLTKLELEVPNLQNCTKRTD
jgi:hypothetical protein